MSYNYGDNEIIQCKYNIGDIVYQICKRYGISESVFRQLNPQVTDLNCVQVS